MLRRLFPVLLAISGLVAVSRCMATVATDCEGTARTAAAAGCGILDPLPGEGAKEDEPDSQGRAEEENSAEESGRRRKDKGKGGYGKMLLYLAGAMKAMMLYVMVHAATALAAKALIAAKVALAIATAIALKKSGDQGDKVSYEIIKHPHYSYAQTHSSSVDYDHHGYGESNYSHRRRRSARRT